MRTKTARSPCRQTLERIKKRTAEVGVIGLGYVGLPLVKVFVEAGFRVTGFDVDEQKVQTLRAGESYIRHIAANDVEAMLATERFDATADPSRLADMDAIVICVPTPLTANRDPDMSYIVGTSQSIREHLRAGQLVVLESTTYPGTLRQVVKPILETTGLQAGDDFFLAYSPEREDPGNPKHSAAFLPKVVGGIDKQSFDLAVALYETIVPKVVGVSTPEVAEACKILENTYRCVNIALVNELKLLFERMGIDIWEVIDAAATKPFGFQSFYPGPGLGGHCIPIDPFYLSWVARQYQFQTRFIELAGEINTSMPEHVIQRVLLALNEHGKPVRGAQVGILGMAYKKDVDDCRESPSLELMSRLTQLGADVSYHDPYIPQLGRMRHYHFPDQTSQPLTADYLHSLDCILIATDHTCFDMEFIVNHSDLVIDTRGATRKLQTGAEKVWAA